MLRTEFTSQFKKDYRHALKRGIIPIIMGDSYHACGGEAFAGEVQRPCFD